MLYLKINIGTFLLLFIKKNHLIFYRVGDEIAIPIDFGGGNRLAPVGKVADKTGQLVSLNVQVCKKIVSFSSVTINRYECFVISTDSFGGLP